MSYDVWIHAFHDRSSTAISREALRQILGPYVSEPEQALWRVRYDEANGSDLYLSLHPDDSSRITGVSVSRPCGDDRLWTSLTAILRSAPFVFYAPDGPPVVADASAAIGLPAEMLEALGEPVCLSGDETIRDVWPIEEEA
jgi:hypothetical protein